ncbi:MAG TPA: helix-turn-helix domain-containing protein [Terriglobia bacterium]
MKGPLPVPRLEDLIANPAALSELPAEVIPALRGELARLDTLLLTQLLASANGQEQEEPQGDHLLTIEEAATKLRSSKDWLYRHAATLPFTIRRGRSLRFSDQGIEKWIAQRAGR